MIVGIIFCQMNEFMIQKIIEIVKSWINYECDY